MKYLYHELVKGDVYKYPVIDENETLITVAFNEVNIFRLPNKVYPDGSYYDHEYGSFWLETEEWKIKYQDSLSHRVSQETVQVFYIYSMKRGKINTRAFVIDGSGVCYHTLVPTSPLPRLGESFLRLRMDLTPISLEPKPEFIEMVMKAREKDSTLI